MNLQINHKFLVGFSDGRPIFKNDRDREFYKTICGKMEGKTAYLTIQPIRKIKTNEQQRYYRGVICARLADHWGLTNQEAHEAIGNEFLQYRPFPGGPRLIRTTALDEWNTIEWEKFMSRVRMWASQEHGVYIEEPNEVDLTSLPKYYY